MVGCGRSGGSDGGFTVGGEGGSCGRYKACRGIGVIDTSLNSNVVPDVAKSLSDSNGSIRCTDEGCITDSDGGRDASAGIATATGRARG
jgi:hypothetical protein